MPYIDYWSINFLNLPKQNKLILYRCYFDAYSQNKADNTELTDIAKEFIERNDRNFLVTH